MRLKGLFVCLIALSTATVTAAADLEPGNGSELVGHACSNCHSLDNVTQLRKNRTDWDNTVHLMVNYGLEISDDDMRKIIDYLSTFYGLQAHKQAK